MGETVSMMGNGNSSSASSSMSMTDLDGMVDGLIQSNCVVIFSKTTCSYCKMAKRVFENLGVPYTAVELNQLHNGRDVQKILASMTGSATVPRVFINGTCIGGGTETRQLQKQGLLLPLLDRCTF